MKIIPQHKVIKPGGSLANHLLCRRWLEIWMQKKWIALNDRSWASMILSSHLHNWLLCSSALSQLNFKAFRNLWWLDFYGAFIFSAALWASTDKSFKDFPFWLIVHNWKDVMIGHHLLFSPAFLVLELFSFRFAFFYFSHVCAPDDALLSLLFLIHL